MPQTRESTALAMAHGPMDQPTRVEESGTNRPANRMRPSESVSTQAANAHAEHASRTIAKQNKSLGCSSPESMKMLAATLHTSAPAWSNAAAKRRSRVPCSLPSVTRRQNTRAIIARAHVSNAMFMEAEWTMTTPELPLLSSRWSAPLLCQRPARRSPIHIPMQGSGRAPHIP